MKAPTINDVANEFAQSITVENFYNRLDVWDIIWEHLHERLKELFDMELDAYDKSNLWEEFNFKASHDEAGACAIWLENEWGWQWRILSIN